MPHILLLETDRLLAQNLTKVLEDNGFSVSWQVDPQEAISDIDSSAADLIIMDLVLAGRSGIEFLYEFRSYPDWQKTPILIYSSIPPAELGACANSLDQLKIVAYHYKPATSLVELAQSAQACLRLVPA
ncbi:MAG TPA: response regulator [Candidatus Binatia bacterium]|nr:response regulator [Candidatus Binatia bacterium]